MFDTIINVQPLLLLHLKSIHGYVCLPQHTICTHPDQDMNYSPFIYILRGFCLEFGENIQNASNVKKFKSLYLRWFRHSATYLYYAMLHRLRKIYNVYQQCEFNVMTVHVYLAFAAQSHCHVLWNCIFHTSLTFDLVLIYSACLSLLSTNL